MAAIEDFANIFGAASTGVQNVTAGVQRVTDETVRTEQKLQQTIDQARDGIAAYGVMTALFQGISAFALLYIAGKVSKKGADK